MSLRFPVVVGVLAVVLAVTAGFGVARIKIDDSSQLFRSDTPEFKLYEREARLFPSSEFDFLIVVEGKTLLERSSIGKLRNLVTDLQLIDGARGIISMFSARQPPENGQLPVPLVADDLPRGAACQQLVGRITSNEIIRGKLLSNDGKLTLIVLALDPTRYRAIGSAASFTIFARQRTPLWPEPASTPVSPASSSCNSRSAMPSSATE